MKKTLLLAQNEALKTELANAERELKTLALRNCDLVGKLATETRNNVCMESANVKRNRELGELKTELRTAQLDLAESYERNLELIGSRTDTARANAKQVRELQTRLAERTAQRDLAAGDYLELHKEHLELGLELELTQRRQRAAEEQRAEAVNNKLQAERRSSRIVCVTVVTWILAGSAWVIACA